MIHLQAVLSERDPTRPNRQRPARVSESPDPRTMPQGHVNRGKQVSPIREQNLDWGRPASPAESMTDRHVWDDHRVVPPGP
jgi:hypothetical protein